MILGLTLAFAAAASCSRKATDPNAALPPEARHGQELYARLCAVCHGERGEGYRADEATRLAHPDFLASVSDSFLRAAITDGRAGSTMSAWSKERGGPLSATDIDAVVQYLRTWDHAPRANLDERLAKGDATRGERIYQVECERCHGAHGVGGPYVRIGNVDFLREATNGFLRLAIQEGRAGTKMPAFGKKLGDGGVEDVVAFLRNPPRPAPPSPARPRLSGPIALGPVPLNPHGPEPSGFAKYPATTRVDVVKHELDRGAKLALLDARAPADYALEHIAGAVSVPFYDVARYLEKLPKSAWLVCYCACPHAESGQLAVALQKQGFTKVTVLEEGLGVWKSKGYPVRSGESP